MKAQRWVTGWGPEIEYKLPQCPRVELAMEFRERFGTWPTIVQDHRGDAQFLGVCERCRLPVFDDQRFQREADGRIEHIRCGPQKDTPRILALRMLLGLQREKL